MPIDHPNAKRVRFAWEGKFNAEWRRVVIVETDLQLNAQHPDFNWDAANGLLQAVGAQMVEIDRQVLDFRLVSMAEHQDQSEK
jgi:hypothetical protein